MPPLARPASVTHVSLPPRQAMVAADTEVLVVGGGPSGLGAALGAASAGADVVLAERYGFLGGNATAALVTLWSSDRTQRQMTTLPGATTFFPTDHGPGEQVFAGWPSRLVERLVREGGAIAPSLATGYTVPFDPEVFKIVAQDMLDEAGVRLLLHAFASGVWRKEETDRLGGVVFETKAGPMVVRAKTVVDCTGDGDIAAMAGARYQTGRKEDGLVQPMTLMFRLAEFERIAFDNYVKAHPGQWRGVHGLWELVEQAARAGDLDLPREDILFFGTPHERELLVNSTRVVNVHGTNVFDLTRAEMEGRRQMRMITTFFRRYVPGFERAYILQSAPMVGVREGRRIRGDYQLTGEDILSARKFPDAVARGTYPIDIHSPTGKGTTLKRVPAGEAYDIPLRCLLPEGVDNLLMAGRCISGTHVAHSSYRVMPIAMATGHAAGVCAALAARELKSPRFVPAGAVQAELARQGAALDIKSDREIVAEP
ncbi:FAD-dependent oxidoreductase [Desulfocurvibacter africanus]|uniref:FAD-dependent oxidoreductase n=1 Tax=Desulfocurvibacter africanus TaxID=873 RepID=UPI000413F1AD|nr:FAD-dependent oxidoreductase [Desulfocurvibacter africanus]